MGKKTSLTSLHLGINKTTSFLSVEVFPKDLRLSLLHDILFVTKLRVGWRPRKFWIKNRRFPDRKPFLYKPKYFLHSVKIVKFCNKIEVSISVWDVTTNKKADKKDLIYNKRIFEFSRKLKRHFRGPFFFIAKGVYKITLKDLEVKVLFQKGSSWLKMLSKMEILKNTTDLERFNIEDVDYSYLKQKECITLIANKRFGFLMQCFLYSIYELNTDLLLKLFCRTLSKIKKKGNKGRKMFGQFVKMMGLLPFIFNGQSIGFTIFLRGRLWLTFRKKNTRLSFGAIRRNSLNRSISESTGKVFTRYGVFSVKILMSKNSIN
jgi:hypothetical protein